MEGNFKIGDKVRIREWDDMAEEFGVNEAGGIKCTCGFVERMKYLCGSVFEITEMRKRSSGRGMIVGRMSGYTISTDMIEPLDKKEDTPDELLDFLKGFGR